MLMFYTRYLFGRQYGHVVFVNDAGFLVHQGRGGLLLQVLTGQPEEQVVLAVLGAQELPEHLSALERAQQQLEAPGPRQHLLQTGASSGQREREKERERRRKEKQNNK